MSKFKSTVLILFIISALISLVCLKPIHDSGYALYSEVLADRDLDSLVDTIKSRPTYVKLSDIPSEYLISLIKSEDKRYYYHFGVDPIAITRAIYHDIRLMRFAEGGSTITQQLAKNLYFSFEKNFERKIAEVYMALKLEKKFTKDEILELYVNIIYFGEKCYGINAASHYYYGVAPVELSQIQIDALVFTIKCPNNYNPKKLGYVE